MLEVPKKRFGFLHLQSQKALELLKIGCGKVSVNTKSGGMGGSSQRLDYVMMVARLKLHMCSWVFLHPKERGFLCSLCGTTSYSYGKSLVARGNY